MDRQTTTLLSILIVDDNPMLRQLLADLLLFLRPDWHIMEAENGQQALECVQTLIPALIVTDFNMPVMNGFEMAMALRRNPYTCNIPLILTSASDPDHQQIAQLRLLCVATLDQPFNLKMLKELLDQVAISHHNPVRPAIRHRHTGAHYNYAIKPALLRV